jgi:hypothetical protein
MMTSAAPDIERSTNNNWTQPVMAWATALAVNAAKVQRLQFAAIVAWQMAALAVNREVWDEWRCRFAGGAPIDG